MRLRALAAVLASTTLALTLAGCGPHTAGSTGPDGVPESDVAVDTPALQAQKAAAGIATCRPGKTGAPVSGAALPNLTLPCLGGGPDVDLATLRGPMIINLWASNCGPCRKELPALQQFSKAYGAKVPVLGVDWLDTYPGAALQLLDDSGVTYPQLADPGGSLLDQRSLDLYAGSPQTLFVNADGTLAGDPAVGGFTSVDQIKAQAEQRFGVAL